MMGSSVAAMIIGYDGFIFGLVKFVRGGFPAGLVDEMREQPDGGPGWYGSFLTSAVMSELLAGAALGVDLGG